MQKSENAIGIPIGEIYQTVPRVLRPAIELSGTLRRFENSENIKMTGYSSEDRTDWIYQDPRGLRRGLALRDRVVAEFAVKTNE